MQSISKRIYNWASLKVSSRFAPLWLGCIFLLELLFFIPLDAILVLFCLQNPQKRYLYSLIATVASTISGVAGYVLGYLAWTVIEPYVINHLISASFFERLSHHYTVYQNSAVFLFSFLPVPFKAVSLSAGVCELVFIPFLAAVFLARLSRFFLIAQAIQRWGVQIKAFIDRYLDKFLLAFVAKIIIAIVIILILSHK